MKFRKKPVVIEAEQFIKGYFEADSIPQEFKDAVCRKQGCAAVDRPHIHTLEGPHFVIVNDWIIKGIKGEFYPIKPDILKLTYDKV
jgi:hypothetical protein